MPPNSSRNGPHRRATTEPLTQNGPELNASGRFAVPLAHPGRGRVAAAQTYLSGAGPAPALGHDVQRCQGKAAGLLLGSFEPVAVGLGPSLPFMKFVNGHFRTTGFQLNNIPYLDLFRHLLNPPCSYQR